MAVKLQSWLLAIKRLDQQLSTRFKAFLVISVALLAGAMAYLLMPKPDLAFYQSYSSAVFDRNNKLLRISLAHDDRYRLYTPIEQIAEHFQLATILYEDQDFYQHAGVDYSALMRAFWQTYVLRERRIGASTITMQVARLRWKLPSNTLSGKAEQIFRALQLARHFSKQEILEAYLNLAPYGGNIEGIGAASLIYFDKPASQLSFAEALTLAVVPQNPSKRNPSTSSGAAAILPAKQRLIERWNDSNPQNKQQTNLVNLPLAVRKTKDLPYDAPHFVQYQLSKRVANDSMYSAKPSAAKSNISNSQRIYTTLDINLQSRMLKVLQAYIQQNQAKGFNNASALLLNSKTMQIEAMIGSADFNNTHIQGQVNGTLAKRSPGSTLKPFVYALALDAGLIHPMTMLKDLPKRYAGFTPENFGRGFVGPISAQDALIRSRNVPAVELQSQLIELAAERLSEKNARQKTEQETGQETKQQTEQNTANIQTFYELLKKAGISKLKPSEFYGLALALGGGEVSMLELVELYAMISNLGVHKSAVSTNWVSGEFDIKKVENGRQLLSSEAAYLIFEMLSKNPTPNDVNTGAIVPAKLEQQQIAWKTGTSWAFRDAWAVGISGDYVLAVWIGNFDGAGNNAFIGRSAAGPLFFNLLNVVSANAVSTQASASEQEEYQPNATLYNERSTNATPFSRKQIKQLNLKEVSICKATGDLYESDCPDKSSTLFIPGVSPIKSTNIYRKIWIDNETGLRRCDINPIKATQKVFAFWPSDFHQLFKDAGVFIEQAPRFLPSCDIGSTATEGMNPVISSPQTQVNYVLQDSLDQPATIPLKANADGGASHLYWFANEHFIGSTDLSIVDSSSPLIWYAKPGTYRVQVSDDLGHSASILVTVLAI